MAKKKLSAEDRRFLDDIAALLVPWGMSSVTARIYGYLLLSASAATLDQIAEELEVSKSSVSVSARALERSSLVRRSGERGSKRIYYEASDTYGNAFRERITMLESMATLLQGRAQKAPSAAIKGRLQRVSTFYLLMRDAVGAAIERVIEDAGQRR